MIFTRSLKSWVALVVATLSMLVGVGCRGRAAAPPQNVLIISIDSLRWDHLGVAGYHRPVTPNIDSLAGRGVYFTRAYSQGSWTKPSIAATFVSAFQSTHRVSGAKSGLPQGYQTMAETFRDRGYRTVGWTNNPMVSSAFGFDQGFEEYNALGGPDPRIVTRLKDLFQSHRRPFLAFVHLMGAHWPYESSKEFNRYDRHPGATSITANNWREINEGKTALTPEDVDHNLALYDGAVQEVDSLLGVVLQLLDDSGLIGNTIVVVMADHGEEFYEHGRVGHGASLADTLIHVPLIMAGPDLPKGRVVDTPVGNVDLLPTLSRLALGSPPAFAQGRDFSPMLAGGGMAESPARPVFSENAGGRAVIRGTWKFIREGDRRELYDILNDPYEKENRIDDVAIQSVGQSLARLLPLFFAENRRLGAKLGVAAKPVVSKELLEQMRSLGYVK
jgi:arylsulfatase